MRNCNSSYEFGAYRLDTVERVLLRDGQPVPLTPKAFETLVVLVQNNGHVVEKDDLMKQVFEEGRKIRDAERKSAQPRRGKKRQAHS